MCGLLCVCHHCESVGRLGAGIGGGGGLCPGTEFWASRVRRRECRALSVHPPCYSYSALVGSDELWSDRLGHVIISSVCLHFLSCPQICGDVPVGG